MEKHIAYASVLALALMLVAVLVGPRLKAVGCALLRDYQVAVAQRETAGWSQLTGKHFVVKYPPGDSGDARLVLDEAERCYVPMGEMFGYFPQGKTMIAVYTDKDALNRVFGWGSEDSAMGVYWAGVIRVLSPSVWLPMSDQSQVAQGLRDEGPMAHEFVHLLVDYRTGGNYTRWLTEGLAQYGEEREGAAPVGGGRPEQLTISLTELDKRFDDPRWQEYSYNVALDLVTYLANRYGEEKVSQLLEALGQGNTMDQAFRKVLGVGLQGFVDGYRAYASNLAV